MEKILGKKWKRILILTISCGIMWISSQWIGMKIYENAGIKQVEVTGLIIGIIGCIVAGLILIYGLGYKEGEKIKIEKYILNVCRSLIYGIVAILIGILVAYLSGWIAVGVYNLLKESLTYGDIESIIYVIVKVIWVLLTAIIYNTIWMIAKEEKRGIEKKRFLKSYGVILGINGVGVLLEVVICLIPIEVLRNVLLGIIYVAVGVTSIMISINRNKGE